MSSNKRHERKLYESSLLELLTSCNEFLAQLSTSFKTLIEDNAERPLSAQENYSCPKPPVMTYFEEINQELLSVQHAVDTREHFCMLGVQCSKC